MENIEYRKEGRKVILLLDGQEEGFLECSNIGGAFQIENAQISREFRGRGLYTTLLINYINIFGAEMLISNNRNEYSNPAYEKWTGQSLEYNQQCNIYIIGEKMFVDVDEE